MRPSLEPVRRLLVPRQNHASVGRAGVHAMIAARCCSAAFRQSNHSPRQRITWIKFASSRFWQCTAEIGALYKAGRISVERRIHRVRTMLHPVRPAARGTTVARQAPILGLRAIARDEAQMDAVRVPAPDHPAAQRDDGAGGSRRNSRQAPRESMRDRFRRVRLENPAALTATFRNDTRSRSPSSASPQIAPKSCIRDRARNRPS